MPQSLKLSIKREVVPLLCSGALLGFSYTEPYLNFFVILLLVPFAACIWTSKAPFLSGFLFGLSWFGVGISWVHVSIADYGGVPLLVSLLMMLMLCAYLALYPALFAWLVSRLRKTRLPDISIMLLIPIIWIFTEWCRSWVLTGFPWLGLGYTQYNTLLNDGLALIGESGLAALLVFIAFLPVYCYSQLPNHTQAQNVVHKTTSKLLPVTFLLCLPLLYPLGLWVVYGDDLQKPSNIPETKNIALVQGNIPQNLRWLPEEDERTVTKYIELTESLWHSDLIVWPEAAIPKLEYFAQTELLSLNDKAAKSKTALITGIVNYDIRTEQIYNNLIVLGQQNDSGDLGEYYYGNNNRFAKHHLLPIGEFIPFEKWLRGLAPIFDLPMSSFTRGEYIQPNLLANNLYLLPAICFEIVFPRQIRANITPSTDTIITVSNDAWFGDSAGPIQHMRIAQVRAKEFGLPVIRATNNGITGIINGQGEIEAQIPQFTTAVLEHELSLKRYATPFKIYGNRLFISYLLLVVLLSLAWVLLPKIIAREL